MTLEQKFLEEISRCKDPVIFLGLSRVLCVKWVDVDSEGANTKDQPVRTFAAVLDDMMRQYSKAPRRLKKDLIKCLRDANNAGEIENAGNTENTETPVQA